jgi:pilus assembly protein CpaB
MNWKTWAPVIGAILLGGIAAKFVRDSMLRPRVAVTDPSQARIVVMRGTVQVGQEVTAEQLAVNTVSAASAPADAFSDPSAVIGRVTTVPLVAGQTVLSGYLAPRGAIAGLSSMIPAGMRAITIDVNESSSLAGMVAPGCRVDVVATLTDGQAGAASARTIVQNVLIQAVGQKLSTVVLKGDDADKKKEDNSHFRTVTIIATPREAEMLQLASGLARMTLVLRGTGDTAPVEQPAVSLAELGGGTSIVPVAFPQTQPTQHVDDHPLNSVAESLPSMRIRTVQLIRGNMATTVEFQLRGAAAQADTESDMKQVLPDTIEREQE